MILTLPMPCLEKSVTEIKPALESQWIQTNPLALEAWLFSALSELSALEQLPEGWDGHHSPRISHSASLKARRLLSSLRTRTLPQPAVMPMTGGGIGLNWEAGDRELQLTIYPDGEVLYLYGKLNQGEPVQDGSLPENYQDELNRLGMWLIG